jgi:hypothetical protein
MVSQRGSCTFSIRLEPEPLAIRAVRKVVAATARLDGASDSDARLIEFSERVTSSRSIPDALGAQEAQSWGLYLIGRVMDEVEITRSTIGDRGTAIRNSKRLIT